MSNQLLSQMVLPFSVPRPQTFINFAGRDNEELITRLSAYSSGFSATWMHGAEGAGKSHLLHAAVHLQQGYGVRCLVIDTTMDRIPALSEVFTDTAGVVVAIDDVSRFIGNRAAETALYALWQVLAAQGGQLLMTDLHSPLALEYVLPDLASRLRSAQVFEVKALDENGVRQLLQRRLRDRGLKLGRPVLDYWLTRRNRSINALLVDLERLDAAAWQAQHRLTIPFLKSVLEF